MAKSASREELRVAEKAGGADTQEKIPEENPGLQKRIPMLQKFPD